MRVMVLFYVCFNYIQKRSETNFSKTSLVMYIYKVFFLLLSSAKLHTNIFVRVRSTKLNSVYPVKEPPHVEEEDLQGAEELLDESQPQERMGVGANAVAFATGVLRPRPNAMPAPTPVTLQLTECYVCTDCPKVISNTTSKVCPHTMDSAKRGKCVVYAEQYKRKCCFLLVSY